MRISRLINIVGFESFPIVFYGIYKFNIGEQGLAFLGIFVGALLVMYVSHPDICICGRKVELISLQTSILLVSIQVYGAPIRREWQHPARETPSARFCGRLCDTYMSLLVWLGIEAGRSLVWSSAIPTSPGNWTTLTCNRIVPIIGSGWFSIGAFLLFNSVLNYLGDAYPDYAASVLAGNDFMRSAFGAAFPLFANAMYKKLGVDWASSTLAFLGIAFIPIPFFLHRVSFRPPQSSWDGTF